MVRRLDAPARGAFLRGVVRAYRTVGAVAPTGRGVALRIAALAGISSVRCVAELGPGTGAITRVLLEALPPDGQLWAFEVYEPFVQHLRATIHDPRLTVVHASAETLGTAPHADAAAGFGAVVSALPFSFMGPLATERVLRAAAGALAPTGCFVALQYHPWFLAPFLRAQFAEVQQVLHVWNLPPALLFRARQPRAMT